jgi:exopolysaccharide biosynthesis WecB/TagA/CpsF family protein
MKTLLIGYACSPRLGSEPGFTWNWALQLSKRHQVWVLAHPHDREGAEEFLAKYPNSNLKCCWVAAPNLLNLWDDRSSNVGLAVRYFLWLKLAHREAIKLHAQIGFHVVHHVSFGTVSAPPPFWKLPIPFVWGPVGGAQRVPSSFHRYFGFLSGREMLRSIRLATLPLSFSLRKAARSSALILATNRETGRLLSKVGGRNVRLFLDSGIPSSFISGPPVPTPADRPFTLLWVGRMEPRTALPLGLEAFVQNQDLNAKLLIAGDGEMRMQWEQYAQRLQLSGKVEFLGQVPWNEMPSLYRRADAFLFPSLRDSFGAQVLEAMGHGLPILTLDHQGVGTFVPEEAGIKVPVTTPRETVAGLAEGIRRLALFPEERLKMGAAARAYAIMETWEKRAERMSNLYEKTVFSGALLAAKSCSTQITRSLSGSLQRADLVKKSMATQQSSSARDNPGFNVLGVRIRAVQTGHVVEQMEGWIRQRNGCHSIAATSMHGIVEAQHDSSFKEILNSTDLVVPDGMPLVWLGRHQGHLLRRRVYGPDLLLAFCEESAERGYRHFFYGGEPGVAERLVDTLKKARFPGLNVVGTYSPPYRPLNAKEDEEIVEMIRRAAPDVLWVGLGAPKQERWMHDHKAQLRVPVLVCVGAAFDMLSGKRKQAPPWMRERGLEWLFRLLQEPRRLWRRYLVYGSQFIIYLLLESLRLKNFDADGSRLPKRTPGRQAPV